MATSAPASRPWRLSNLPCSTLPRSPRRWSPTCARTMVSSAVWDGSFSQPARRSGRPLPRSTEIYPEAVADQIERSLGNIEGLSEFSSDARRALVRALEKIAFHAHTFEEGARLLLRVASDETETLSRLPADSDIWRPRWDSGAVGKFKGLSPCSWVARWPTALLDSLSWMKPLALAAPLSARSLAMP